MHVCYQMLVSQATPSQKKYRRAGQLPILISFSPSESGGTYLTCIAYGVGAVCSLIVTYNVGGLKYSVHEQNEIGMGS
jgi:hypothetical protein